MNIVEAVKSAIESGCYITRASIDDEKAFHRTRIKPTNSYGNCIAYTFDQNGNQVHHCKNWNPSADDLMSEDWILSD